MAQRIEFHNTPGLVREYVKNWLLHAKKDKQTQPAQLAMLEDIAKLIDVAMTVLEPMPTESANNDNPQE